MENFSKNKELIRLISVGEGISPVEQIKNFDSIDQIIETNKQIKYDYFNSILFRKFIKEVIVNYSQAG